MTLTSSSAALLDNIKNINQLVEFCNAQESGKLGTSSTVGAIKSQYQKDKRGAALSLTLEGPWKQFHHMWILHRTNPNRDQS